MRTISLRLPEAMIGRLEVLAADWKVDRSTVLRRLIEEAAPLPEGTDLVPGPDELLALLAERARSGNVAAIRCLLDRQERAQGSDTFELAER